jgi:nuclear GTP-binding protein
MTLRRTFSCAASAVWRTWRILSNTFRPSFAVFNPATWRGGEPDLDGVAKMVINDFLRGKIPWYTPPPKGAGADNGKIEGREGRLGEMGRKRKLDETASEPAAEAESSESQPDGEFEGFDGEDDDDNDSIANLEVSDVESGEED